MNKDMTVGKPGKTLFFFAVPMVLGNLFQQLYNIVDSMIVGNFVGSDALAAVGASASITFLFVAIATGMSVGSSVVISQFFGARQMGKVKTCIYTILLFAAVLSAALTVIGVGGSGAILRWMNTPDNVFADASTYLRIYFAGMFFLFTYNTLTSIFNALGDSRSPLVFLAFSSLTNIVLDLVFVIRFGMGVAGVAYATLISQGISAVLSFIWLMIRLSKMQIREEFSYFDFQTLKTIWKIAVPSTIQQSIVSIGFVLVQALVNRYGSVVMAGYAAAGKIDSIAILPMVNVGNAMSTFTAQNTGAGKPERVTRGLRAGWIMSGVIGLIVTVILFLWGDVFVGAFVDTASNLEVIAVGVEYLRVVSTFYVVMGVMNTANGVLRGAGDIKVFLASALCNLGSRVILAYALAYVIGKSAIWWAIPIGWSIGLIISLIRLKSGKWKGKSLVDTTPLPED